MARVSSSSVCSTRLVFLFQQAIFFVALVFLYVASGIFFVFVFAVVLFCYCNK